MNNWYEALEVCSDFIEAWLCYHFIGIFLPDRVRGRLPFFLLSMTLVCSVKAMNAYGIDPLISTLWFVFFICMTTVVLFQVDLFYAVSLVSFYFLCLYVINFFCMSVMGVIAGNRQFAGFILNQLSLWRCAYIAADKAMLFSFCFLAGRAFRGTTFYNPASWAWASYPCSPFRKSPYLPYSAGACAWSSCCASACLCLSMPTM